MSELQTILSSMALSGALVWILRNMISTRLKYAIKAEYDRDLEIHKAQLKASSDLEIEKLRLDLAEKLESHKAQLKFDSDILVEQLKAKLQITAHERNTQYSKVFDKTLDVIAEVSALLHTYLEAVAYYTSVWNNVPGPDMDDRRAKAGGAYAAFLKFYRPRRLFIPKGTAAQIDAFHGKLHSISVDFMVGVDQGPRNAAHIDTWGKAYDFVSKEIPVLIELLEDDFRIQLGMLHADQKP